MGFTQTYYRKPELNSANFEKIVSDFKIMVPELQKIGIELGNGVGIDEPCLENDVIIFNGLTNCNHKEDFAIQGGHSGLYCEKSDCGNESFVLEQKYEPNKWQEPDQVNRFHNYCKTERKPYDLAVQICLIIAKHHLGEEIEVTSDGETNEWMLAMEMTDKTLGYGLDFVLGE